MDPVAEPVQTTDALSHVVGTASGGGFVAALLAFFQSREKSAMRDRLTALETEVANLRSDLNAIAPRRLVGKRRKKK